MLTDFADWALGEQKVPTASGVLVTGKCGCADHDEEVPDEIGMTADERRRHRKALAVRRHRQKLESDPVKLEEHRRLNRLYSRMYKARKRGLPGLTPTQELARKWREPVRKYLSSIGDEYVLTAAVIRAVGGTVEDETAHNSTQHRAVCSLIKECGWRSVNKSISGYQTWVWVRG